MNDRRLFTVLIIFLCTCVALFFLKLSWVFSDKNSDKVYNQGLEFYKANDFQNAYYNFNKISVLSSYYPAALYRSATSAWEIGDYRTAYKKYSKFSKIYKNTDLAPVAVWRAALAQLEIGNKKRAKKLFLKLKKRYPDSDFAKAASYKLGVLYMESSKQKAKDSFIEYIEYAPLGRFSQEVLNFLDTFEDPLFSDTDRLYIAKAWFEHGEYKKSISRLNEIPFDLAWMTLAKNYDKTSDIPSLSKTILKGVSLKSQTNIEEKEILDIMALYIKRANIQPKQAAYNLTASSKNTPYYPLALFLYSKYLDPKKAAANYETIYNYYPDSMVAPDALWMNFWLYYKNGFNSKALTLSKLYTNLYFDYNIQPKIMFWSAKANLRMGRNKPAKLTLHNIVSNFPNSYYAFRANAMLKGDKTPWNVEYNLPLPEDRFFVEFPMEQSLREYKLLKKYSDLNDYGAIQSFKIDNDFVNSWLMAKNGDKSYSVVLARDAIIENRGKFPFSSPKFKLAYPLYYTDLISRYSRLHNLSPYLIIALIREESFFNPDATSATGARGLMQLMPDTARMVDISSIPSRLYEPDYNIGRGVRYFSYLMKVFDGNEALCVLAYNSGPGSVQKWLQNSQTRDFDEFVEDIPYSETANYIKKVYASYWSYMNIYGKK